MKKILFGISMFLVTLISAQNYPDYYPNSENNIGYYGDEEDSYYFPDDYYYQYPSDYYTNDYYQSNYNEYRNSIYKVNWNQFFVRYRLSPWQIQQIMMLNDTYPSYTAWNSYYRYNPDRWYYDRFYALENILGPRVFVIFQNKYYHGNNPVVYYQNYRRQHYVTNIYVVPRYRNININRYRVDRTQYHQTNPRQNFGFRDNPRNGNGNLQNNSNTGGFRDNVNSSTNSSNNGFRNEDYSGNSPRNNGFRNNSNEAVKPNPRTENNGFRNTNTDTKIESNVPNPNSGFRNSDSGSRNSTPQRKVESDRRNQRTSPPASRSTSKSGFRFTSK